jgi:hydrogenase nickel incorporation protein HypA/HybF
VHETGVIRRLMEAALAAARAEGGGPITRVGVKVGALTGLSAGHLREHWAEEVAGTSLAAASLDVTASEDPADPDALGVVLEWVELSAATP